MRWPDWEIGRALGIPIRVHASWFLVFVFMTWTLATGYLPEALPGLSSERYWGMGAVAAILLFLSVLLHELGHSYVAQHYRIPIGQITLFLFGGVAHMAKEPPNPRAEFLIAIAGPIVSFVLGAGCLAMAAATEASLGAPGMQGFVVLGGLLGLVNVQLGLFNLIPGFPLDGGRVLRAGLWAWSKNFHRATGQAATIGVVCGFLFGGLGALLLGGSIVGTVDQSMAGNGGWLLFIGAFLFSAAWSARRQILLRQALDLTAVRDVMIRTIVSIEADLSVQRAVDDYFIAQGSGGFPVTEAGQVVGLITVDDVQALSQGLWPWRIVREVMRPASPGLFVAPDYSIKQALDRMVQDGWDQLVVVEDEKPIGLLTRAAVAQFLQLRKSKV
jgi:Zn-dependent protease/CBS domain-containing protein